MGRELEMKFACPEGQLAALAERFAPLEQTQMETRYFDTPDRSLGRKKWMLRLRLENGVSICTLKTPLPDGSRGEWETEADTLAAALPRLTELGAPGPLPEPEALGQVCAAGFLRRSRLLRYPGGEAELALDLGCLTGRSRSIPLWEIELEYKSGSEEAFTRFAAAFAQTHSLTPEPKSKYQRALSLE